MNKDCAFIRTDIDIAGGSGYCKVENEKRALCRVERFIDFVNRFLDLAKVAWSSIDKEVLAVTTRTATSDGKLGDDPRDVDLESIGRPRFFRVAASCATRRSRERATVFSEPLDPHREEMAFRRLFEPSV